MTDSQWVSICLLVGAFLAAVYGVFAGIALAQARRSSPVRPDGTRPNPRSVSPGEAFESTWQGSRGYELAPPQDGANLTDRLVVATVTPLRPSQFRDPAYWRTYLPIVAGISVMLVIGLPLLALLVVPSSPPSTFRPTAAQRSALVRRAAVTQPTTCDGAGPVKETSTFDPTSGSVTDIDYSADGGVFTVHPGAHVVISYYGGLRPSFSPGTPLCPAAAPSPSRDTVDYVATRRGTGFIYFPQLDGSAFVARIDVVGVDIPVVPMAIAVVIVAVDLLVWVRLRRYGR